MDAERPLAVRHDDTPEGWRQGASALAVLTFPMDGITPIYSAGRRYRDHTMVVSHQAFEAEVAVPRLLGLLTSTQVRATFFVPGLVAEAYPGLIASLLDNGHEVAHHSYSHRPPTQLSAAEERAEFERGLEALARVGVTPRGYRAPMWAATPRTANLVAEYGMIYDSSLMNRDQPYHLGTSTSPIVEVPPHWSLDDWEQYAYLIDPPIGQWVNRPQSVVSMWIDELDAMAETGSLFTLTSHAFLTGRAGRVVALRRLIEHAQSRGDIRFVTAGQLAESVLAMPVTSTYTLTPPPADPEIYPTW